MRVEHAAVEAELGAEFGHGQPPWLARLVGDCFKLGEDAASERAGVRHSLRVPAGRRAHALAASRQVCPLTVL